MSSSTDHTELRDAMTMYWTLHDALSEGVHVPPPLQELDEAVAKVDDAAIATLQSAYCGRLEFGTAGLRGEMAHGFARMNDVTVMQAAQGLAAYLASTFGAEAASRGVVIGYDHRARDEWTSQRFARLTAIACLHKGLKVYLYNKLVATPLVPYGITKYGAIAGVMVTASHNPKQDNGYKVYGGNGAQIISPVDKHIATAIQDNLLPWPECLVAYKMATEADVRARGGALCVDVTEEAIASYLADASRMLCRHASENSAVATAPLNICYTAMHGVGRPFTTAMFDAFKLRPLVMTPEQVEPDATFPTVAFPNPEEGKGALALAMAAARAHECTLILANDPDADRLAVAEWQPESKEWRVFSGNEIGSLLAAWSWRCYVEAGGRPQDAVMLASTVSSKFIAAMAKAEGFTFEETLTGFKWMGNATDAHMKAKRNVLFSFEEAIGFCCGTVVRDKDGVVAAAVFGEMANTVARESGKTLVQHLADLYAKYGVFVSNNNYVFVDAPEKTLRIFARLRNEGHYWSRLGDLSITAIRDLTGSGLDTEYADGKPRLPTSSGTQMITYKFSNGVVATLRTSGTEPKLKFYTELSGSDVSSARAELNRTVNLIVDEMLQPTKYGLKRPITE